jgi:hypothetical protein
LRARYLGHKCWKNKYADCYAKHCNAHEIRRGFVDAFVAMAQGDQCGMPAIAPSCGSWWCNHGSCCDGKNGWFFGYELGTACAESCGVNRWARTNCNPHLLNCLHGNGGSCMPGCEPCGGQSVGEMIIGPAPTMIPHDGSSLTPTPAAPVDGGSPSEAAPVGDAASATTFLPEESLGPITVQSPSAVPAMPIGYRTDGTNMIDDGGVVEVVRQEPTVLDAMPIESNANQGIDPPPSPPATLERATVAAPAIRWQGLVQPSAPIDLAPAK